MRTFKAVLAVLSLVAIAACSDSLQDPLHPPSEPSHAISEAGMSEVPPRSEDETEWEDMSDGELWEHIAELDSTVVIGLKAPGARRGIWHDRLLISRSRQAEGRQAIQAMPGVRVLDADTLLPVLHLKVPDQRSLTRLRRLPFTDYVEPGLIDVTMASGGISGCRWQHVNVNNYPKTFAGDLLTPNYAKANVRITEAWKRSNGSGVTIGVPDSGVNNQAPMNQWFATGQRTGRWHAKLFRKGATPHGPCSHGTRVAGVIAAPMNGSSAAGIAWGSNLVTVRVFDEAPYHHFPPSRFWLGIRDAATHRPADRGGNQNGHANQRIVTLAWNTRSSNAIRDEIRTWHGRGRLFLGAAGQGLGRLHTNQIGFPARMPEVVAVSAVNVDGSRRARYHYGPDVEMSFYEQSGGHRQKAPGETTFEVSDLRGTSSTVAAVSGIAALIWSQYPNWSRDQVRTRLQQSGDSYPRRFSTGDRHSQHELYPHRQSPRW